MLGTRRTLACGLAWLATTLALEAKWTPAGDGPSRFSKRYRDQAGIGALTTQHARLGRRTHLPHRPYSRCFGAAWQTTRSGPTTGETTPAGFPAACSRRPRSAGSSRSSQSQASWSFCSAARSLHSLQAASSSARRQTPPPPPPARFRGAARPPRKTWRAQGRRARSGRLSYAGSTTRRSGSSTAVCSTRPSLADTRNKITHRVALSRHRPAPRPRRGPPPPQVWRPRAPGRAAPRRPIYWPKKRFSYSTSSPPPAPNGLRLQHLELVPTP